MFTNASFYEGDYLILLLTIYKSSGPHALREEDVFMFFLMYDLLMTPGAWPIKAPGA